MRVKLLIALVLASVFLLAGALQAGAVEGVNVIPGVTTLVFQAPNSPITAPALSIPATIENAPIVTNVNTITANAIALAPPNISAAIVLGTPAAPGFVAPDFEGPNIAAPELCAPVFSFPTFFDPA